MKLSQRIKRLSHRELALDDRYTAAAEVTAILLPGSLGGPDGQEHLGINADTPDLVWRGYLRSLGEMLQHVLQVIKEAREDPRFWRLLDVVISAEGVDESVLDMKLPSTAKDELQDCLEKGDFGRADALSGGLTDVFGTIHKRFTLGVFTSAGKWVEFLGACFALLKTSERSTELQLSNVKNLLQLLLTGLVRVVREDKAWFTLVVNHLLVSALEWMMTSPGGNDPKDPTRVFLEGVLFRKSYAEKFSKFFVQQVNTKEDSWRDLDLDKDVKKIKNPALLILKVLKRAISCDGVHSRVDDIAQLWNARSAVLKEVPWIFQNVCNLLEDIKPGNGQGSQSDLRFKCFVAFLALVLPSPNTYTTGTNSKKRKACSVKDVPWENLQTVGKLLQICSTSGVYNPLHENSVHQISILRKVMEEAMEAWERKKSTKCQKAASFARKRYNPRAPLAEDAIACVVKGILPLEHRVTLEYVNTVIEIAFLEHNEQVRSSMTAHGSDILTQLTRVYKDTRQLDVLLEILLKHARLYSYKECIKALNRSFLAQMHAGVSCAPPMQRKELIKIGFQHLALCLETLKDSRVLVMAEIVCIIMGAVEVTVSEADSVAAICAHGLQEVLLRTIGEGHSTDLPLKGSAALTLAVLKIYCSTVNLHRKCEMIDPNLGSLHGFSIKHSPQCHSNWKEIDLGRALDEFICKCISHPSLQIECKKGCDSELENAWRKVCMECLLQQIAVTYTAWHKHGATPPLSKVDKTACNGIESKDVADGGKPSHVSLLQNLQVMTKSLFSCIPFEWYLQIDIECTLQDTLGTEPLLSSTKETISIACWIDLCASFPMWVSQAEGTTLTAFFGVLIKFVVGSYRKEKSTLHMVEAASWEVFTHLDSFTDHSVQCKLIECLGDCIKDLLHELSAHSGTNRFKKISWQDFFGAKEVSPVPLQLVLKQATENAKDSGRLRGNRDATPDVKFICRLKDAFDLGAGLPWECFSSQAKKGTLIGLGACAAILMESVEVRMSLLACSTGLIVWIAHASVSGVLDEDQIAFMVCFSADIVQLATAAGSTHEEHVIQVLECMGFLGMSHKVPLDLIPMVLKGSDPSTSLKHVACVWDAVATGICRWAAQKHRKKIESSCRKLVADSLCPLEHSCAQRLQNHQKEMRREHCERDMCRAVAACIKFHRNGSGLVSTIPPAIALVPEVMGTLLDAQTRESIHSLPAHTLLGLVDFVSQISGVLCSLHPCPSDAMWMSLFHFHLLLIPPVPTSSGVDPMIQTSILMDSNPTIFCQGDDTNIDNLRQCVAKSMVMLFDVASQTRIEICDKFILAIIDTATSSQKQECTYAITQALAAGLSAYQPQQDVLRTLPESLINILQKTLISMRGSECAEYDSICICLMLRALAIIVRSSTNTTFRHFASEVSRVGLIVFSRIPVEKTLRLMGGPFVECCNVISMIAARHSSGVLGAGVSSLLESFHALLETLGGWACTSPCDARLTKCIDSVNIASGKLAKLHGSIESLLVGLTSEYIQAVAKVQYATQGQSKSPVEKVLFQGCLVVYLATTRVQRKRLHDKFRPTGSRFVIDLLEEEGMRCIKYKRKV